MEPRPMESERTPESILRWVREVLMAFNTRSAASRSVFGRMMTNSSPPIRASTSRFRQAWVRISATFCNRSSPRPWPKESLISLSPIHNDLISVSGSWKARRVFPCIIEIPAVVQPVNWVMVAEVYSIPSSAVGVPNIPEHQADPAISPSV